MNGCKGCAQLGDICARCERIGEERLDPAVSRSDEEFAVRQAERKYERQLFGRSA